MGYKFFCRLAFNILLGLVLVGAFFLLKLIILIQAKTSTQSEDVGIAALYGIMCSIAVAVTNLLVRTIIIVGILVEKRTTYTGYYKSICWKLTVA